MFPQNRTRPCSLCSWSSNPLSPPPPFFFLVFSFPLLSLPSLSLLNPVIDFPAASSRYTRTVVGLDRHLPSSSTPSGRVRIDVPVKNTFLLPLPQSRRARGIPVSRRWALALSVCISGSRGIVPVLVLVPVPALTLAFVLGQASLDQHMPLETKSAHVADRQPKKKNLSNTYLECILPREGPFAVITWKRLDGQVYP